MGQAAIEKQQQLQQQQQQTNGNNANNQNRAGWRSVFRRGSMAATDAAGADDGSTGDESDISASKDSEAIIAGLKSEIMKISVPSVHSSRTQTFNMIWQQTALSRWK